MKQPEIDLTTCLRLVTVMGKKAAAVADADRDRRAELFGKLGYDKTSVAKLSFHAGGGVLEEFLKRTKATDATLDAGVLGFFARSGASIEESCAPRVS